MRLQRSLAQSRRSGQGWCHERPRLAVAAEVFVEVPGSGNIQVLSAKTLKRKWFEVAPEGR